MRGLTSALRIPRFAPWRGPVLSQLLLLLLLQWCAQQLGSPQYYSSPRKVDRKRRKALALCRRGPGGFANHGPLLTSLREDQLVEPGRDGFQSSPSSLPLVEQGKYGWCGKNGSSSIQSTLIKKPCWWDGLANPTCSRTYSRNNVDCMPQTHCKGGNQEGFLPFTEK